MKIEMHVHTSQASPCAHVSADRIPAMYRNAGYDGIVITDHCCKWARDRLGAESPEEYMECFLNGYRTAKKAAEETGFLVLLGAEINLPDSPNDYLLYGTEEEFFQKYPQLYTLSLRELYPLCRKNDILLFQAHPYRTYCTPAKPEYLDGAESYNGNPRHNNQNQLAAGWASQNHLICSSGSDFHETEDLARGGIETLQPIHNNRELCRSLTEGSYRLIQP